jgi:hypothetical protein
MATNVQEPKGPDIHGSPGQGARVSGLIRVLWPLLLLLLVLGYVLGSAFPLPGVPMTLLGVLLLAGSGGLGALLIWSEKRLGQHLKGARGEEQTARLLSMLPEGFDVFHSVPLPGHEGSRDIDHVVMGENRIWLIETKNWSGELRFDDEVISIDGIVPDRAPIQQTLEQVKALQEAVAVAAGAKPVIHPVLCFIGSRLGGGLGLVGGVEICDGAGLLTSFQNGRAPELTPDVIQQTRNYLMKAVES